MVVDVGVGVDVESTGYDSRMHEYSQQAQEDTSTEQDTNSADMAIRTSDLYTGTARHWQHEDSRAVATRHVLVTRRRVDARTYVSVHFAAIEAAINTAKVRHALRHVFRDVASPNVVGVPEQVATL